jgi:cytochrome c oxidase cbb3-type subunit 4
MSTGAYLVFTGILLALFVGVLVWAFGRKRKKRFEQDARIPFQDDE